MPGHWQEFFVTFLVASWYNDPPYVPSTDPVIMALEDKTADLLAKHCMPAEMRFWQFCGTALDWLFDRLVYLPMAALVVASAVVPVLVSKYLGVSIVPGLLLTAILISQVIWGAPTSLWRAIKCHGTRDFLNWNRQLEYRISDLEIRSRQPRDHVDDCIGVVKLAGKIDELLPLPGRLDTLRTDLHELAHKVNLLKFTVSTLPFKAAPASADATTLASLSTGLSRLAGWIDGHSDVLTTQDRLIRTLRSDLDSQNSVLRDVLTRTRQKELFYFHQMSTIEEMLDTQIRQLRSENESMRRQLRSVVERTVSTRSSVDSSLIHTPADSDKDVSLPTNQIESQKTSVIDKADTVTATITSPFGGARLNIGFKPLKNADSFYNGTYSAATAAAIAQLYEGTPPSNPPRVAFEEEERPADLLKTQSAGGLRARWSFKRVKAQLRQTQRASQ